MYATKWWRGFLVIVVFALATSTANAKIEQIPYRNWKNCYKISNATAEIIVNPNYGGHILYYGLKSQHENALWADSALNGYSPERYLKDGKNRVEPDAGRFDIGIETLTDPIHDTLWTGQYSTKIIDKFILEVTSLPAKRAGVQVSRVYALDNETSRLKVTQTLKNIGSAEVKYSHWSRTLVPLGGVYIAQFKKTDRYPRGLVQWGWRTNSSINENTLAPGLNIVNDSLLVARPGGKKAVKIAINTTTGWCSYINKNIVFLKKFDYYPTDEYNNNPGYAFPNCIYYDERFLEIEPNSPIWKLLPGETSSYSETWQLLDYPKPTGEPFNAVEAARFSQEWWLHTP